MGSFQQYFNWNCIVHCILQMYSMFWWQCQTFDHLRRSSEFSIMPVCYKDLSQNILWGNKNFEHFKFLYFAHLRMHVIFNDH